MFGCATVTNVSCDSHPMCCGSSVPIQSLTLAAQWLEAEHSCRARLIDFQTHVSTERENIIGRVKILHEMLETLQREALARLHDEARPVVKRLEIETEACKVYANQAVAGVTVGFLDSNHDSYESLNEGIQTRVPIGTIPVDSLNALLAACCGVVGLWNQLLKCRISRAMLTPSPMK